ncbi:hypothetical protein LLEC1_07995 [Akanthomyces lecanii]|uniref:Uncharacterized protein n=1 Tax=Cordyceps confragosa TaxID=2714763 RepID=A0A179I4W9_CORDF|nr:hypothetical protein LLEC1_07995 [Akanthomyces lecanii]
MSVSSSFGIKCPGDSQFYNGNNTATFLGCCAIDPATTSDGLCPDDGLRATTFNPTAYSSIPKQECMGNDSSALWYVCAYTKPPFMGCCAARACDEGCAQADLRPAKLSSNIEDANVFLGPSVSTSTTSLSLSSATSTTATTTTSTASPSSSPVPSNSGNQGMKPGAQGGGRRSVPPEYSAAAKHSPAPTELPGSATTAVFELHEETSPSMRSNGFGHR